MKSIVTSPSAMLVLGLALAACNVTKATGEAEATGRPTAERFVLVQRVITADDRQQYVHVLDGLSGGRLEPTGGYEIGGYAQFNYYEGFLYVSNGDDKTLTRFALTADGKLETKGVLSFTNFGLSGSPVPEFIGNEAWIWNGAEAIIVDLSAFEIATSEPVDFSSLYEGVPSTLLSSTYVTGAAFHKRTRVRDGKLYVTVSAMSYDDPLAVDGYFGRARVGIIDVKSRKLLTVLDDARCMSDGDTSPIEADGGFYVTGTAAQTFETVWGNGTHTCLLRFDTTTDQFDPNGYVDVHALSGGYEALEMNWFKDGIFYFPATDTAKYGSDPDRWNAILGSNPARWMMLDVRRRIGREVTGPGLDAMGPWGNAWLFEDRVFLDVTRGASGVQSEETTLVEVDPETQVATPRLTYAGDAVGFFRVLP